MCVAHKTDQTMKLQQRAWLAPRGLKIPENFPKEIHKYTEVTIVIENVGREPAARTNEALIATNLPLGDYRNAQAVEDLIKKEMMADKDIHMTSCRELSTNPKGRAIYPGQPVGAVIGLSKEQTDLALARTHFALIAGCLVYETVNSVHYSEVCSVLEPTNDGNWRSTFCTTHTGAN